MSIIKSFGSNIWELVVVNLLPKIQNRSHVRAISNLIIINLQIEKSNQISNHALVRILPF